MCIYIYRFQTANQLAKHHKMSAEKFKPLALCALKMPAFEEIELTRRGASMRPRCAFNPK